MGGTVRERVCTDPPPVDPRDAVTGLSIIECAERSAREGRSLRFSPPGAR